MPEPFIPYILMHKNIPVAELTLDTASGAIVSIGAVWESAHVPVGIPVRKQTIDRGALNEWWKARSIPASRSGIQDALTELCIPSTQLLMEKCLGFSLSDQYWICPAGSGLSWEQANFFENPFSKDVGDILFGRGADGGNINLMSPDNTSDGWLKKKWLVLDGKRFLLKGGSGATCQEPYNEVLAGRICGRLGIPHVTYTLMTNPDAEEMGGYPYSMCGDFITPDTELVTAWYIMRTEKKPNHVSVHRHYLDCCGKLGVPGIREAVDRMIVLDYLIVNEDRHQNNFGVIRRADTLEYVSAAPIYDSGTSLWFDKPAGMIHAGVKAACKPFKGSHEEQIKLVTDFAWLDFSALTGIDEELREIVKGSLFVDETRCSALCKALKGRVRMLQEAALSARHTVFFDSTKSDVMRDFPYSGKELER